VPEVVTLEQLGKHSGYTAKFPFFGLESGQKNTDKVTVIDVKTSLLKKIMPAESDLSYLAHVRMGTDAAGNPNAIKSASNQSVFTSAQFALEMIEGVDRVIFSKVR